MEMGLADTMDSSYGHNGANYICNGSENHAHKARSKPGALELTEVPTPPYKLNIPRFESDDCSLHQSFLDQYFVRGGVHKSLERK